MPKYLALRTITAPEWNNTALLGDDMVGSVEELKTSLEGNILVYGSASVCHALISSGLVDEFALMIYPAVLGRGIRFFPEGVKSNWIRWVVGPWAATSRCPGIGWRRASDDAPDPRRGGTHVVWCRG